MRNDPESIQSLLRFIDAAPSPYHAVAAALGLLGPAVERLDEREQWKLEPGKTYYLTRNGSTLAAFRLPREKGTLSFRIIGAHTDSPCLRLKPQPQARVGNYRQWGVEVYGGALLNSWLDRDLKIAGRACRWRGGLNPRGRLESRLVEVAGTPVRVPQLAIHLDRGVNENGLKLNPQTQLTPVLGLEPEGTPPTKLRLLEAAGLGDWAGDATLSLDLMLSDSQPSARGGLDGEFIYAPRLDNLAMCHAACLAFESAEEARGIVPFIALFDNEEVGSRTAQGAGSQFLPAVLERVWEAAGGGGRGGYLAALARSNAVSADMAHALHPNYSDRHDPQHRPLLGGGPVIKGHASMNYATLAAAAAGFREACRRAASPLQEYIHRSDLPCGSTIGPIIGSLTGLPVVDAGSPMLSMHSCREMAAAADHPLTTAAFREFLSGE